MLHLHIMCSKSNMEYLCRCCICGFERAFTLYFFWFRCDENNRGVCCALKEHVLLNWLYSIGDHQPKSNRCKLNKPKKIRHNIFIWNICLCLSHTHSHVHEKYIPFALWDMTIASIYACRPFSEAYIHQPTKDTHSHMKVVWGNRVNETKKKNKKGRELS